MADNETRARFRANWGEYANHYDEQVTVIERMGYDYLVRFDDGTHGITATNTLDPPPPKYTGPNLPGSRCGACGAPMATDDTDWQRGYVAPLCHVCRGAFALHGTN